MLRKLLKNAQSHDKDAMEKLIQHFYPLFKKYSIKLNYEDAYEDMILWFIELVKSKKLEMLQEEVIVSYIHVCVVNYYDKKIEKVIKEKREVIFSDLSEEQIYFMEVKMAKGDTQDIFWELNMVEVLNDNELHILHLVFNEGYSTAEIARKLGKTRQAINQQKKRALHKLKQFFQEGKKK